MKLKHWPTLLNCQIGEIRPRFRKSWLACDSVLVDFSAYPHVSGWPKSIPPFICRIICLINHQMPTAGWQAREDVPGSGPPDPWLIRPTYRTKTTRLPIRSEHACAVLLALDAQCCRKRKVWARSGDLQESRSKAC